MDADTVLTIAALPFYSLAVTGTAYATIMLIKAGAQLFESTQAQQVQENTAGNSPK